MGENDEKGQPKNHISGEVAVKGGNYVAPPITGTPDGIPYGGKPGGDIFLDGNILGTFGNITAQAGAMAFSGENYPSDYSLFARTDITLHNTSLSAFARHIHMPGADDLPKADDRTVLASSISQKLGHSSLSLNATHIVFGNDKKYSDIGLFWKNIASTTALSPMGISKLRLSMMSGRYIDSDPDLLPFQRINGAQWESAAAGTAEFGKNLSTTVTGRHNSQTGWGAMTEVIWKPSKEFTLGARVNSYEGNVGQMILGSISYAPNMINKTGLFADILRDTNLSAAAGRIKYDSSTPPEGVQSGLLKFSVNKGINVGKK